jgi:hypothetical protein
MLRAAVGKILLQQYLPHADFDKIASDGVSFG